MKKFLLVILMIISLPLNFDLFGSTPDKLSFNRDLIIKNLINGVRSENYGLRTSSAFLLGEFKSSEAVIDLLAMLHNEVNEDARIMAALSLLKINDSRGIYAIKQAIRFDKSERVKKMCEKFYFHYLETSLK